MLLKGEQLAPARAKALGLVDRGRAAPATCSTRAKRWIRETPRKVQPWDEDGFRLPGGKVYSPAGFNLFPAAIALYRRETYDNYPAHPRHAEGVRRGPAGAVRRRRCASSSATSPMSADAAKRRR